MLAIDDLRKLADMQIRLLKITTIDREINLKKYKDLIVQIDEYAFENFLSGLDQVNANNQTLESEIQYLRKIREDYQQILEQQLEFKRNCELYGDNSLQLSDLSVVNVDYIDNRIKNIDGYLTSKANLKKCRISLEKLNEELLSEEKNKQLHRRKMLELEEKLRNNFINAEGRFIVNGQLQYTSVVSEYKELGYDVQQLLNDRNQLEKLLLKANEELFDAEDKLKVAEMCYKNDFSGSSFSILDDIKMETLKIRYRVSMLKIVELLLINNDVFKLFKEKRENLLSLIKCRVDCFSGLGIKMSIDPFDGIKIVEQIESTSSFEDSIENISRIKKEILQLDVLLEQLTSKNSEYMTQLSNKEDIIKSKFDLIDDVFLDEKLDIDGKVSSDVGKILDNQVVLVKDISEKFNMSIVAQKTKKVIKRVNEMVNVVSLPPKEEKVVEMSPELVIVQEKVYDTNEGLLVESPLNVDDVLAVDELFNNFSEGEDEVLSNNEVVEKTEEIDENIFVDSDKIDEVFSNDDKLFGIKNNEEVAGIDSDIDTSFEMRMIDESGENNDENIFVGEDKVDEVNYSSDEFFGIKNSEEVADIDLTVDTSFEMQMIDESNKNNAEIIFADFDKADVDEVSERIIPIDENVNDADSDIFMTVDPFVETPFFNDRVENETESDEFFVSVDDIVEDDIVPVNKMENSIDLKNNEDNFSMMTEEVKIDDLKEEMPDAFWVVEEDEDKTDEEEVVLSFDEQVDKLMEEDNVKIRKLAA